KDCFRRKATSPRAASRLGTARASRLARQRSANRVDLRLVADFVTCHRHRILQFCVTCMPQVLTQITRQPEPLLRLSENGPLRSGPRELRPDRDRSLPTQRRLPVRPPSYLQSVLRSSENGGPTYAAAGE